MLGQENNLLQTKLHRPPLPVGMVRRPRLTGWLNQHRGRPLTLVSAPAGYGKSTLISCWLESVDCPTAWLSLDEHDNELGGFLSYFLAAIETIFPNAMLETQALSQVSPLPPIPIIANKLINELNQIERQYILVLDDYHLIETGAIHELLNELLLHPPCNLHLAMCTRMDPPLSLVTLRAKGQLTEVRVSSLRFNQEESRLLLQEMIDAPIDRAELVEIESQTEGWVTGLRLAALAMRHRVGRDSVQGGLPGQNRYVTEYLIAEVLKKHAGILSDCMLKTSILERFCASLCEAVCFHGIEISDDGSADSDFAKADFNGEHFLKWLEASNLFVIPLDDRGEWFRYHHLFQDFLSQELARRFGPPKIAKLHIASGSWFAQNGWIEDALYHLLAAGENSAAIELVAQHRYKLMNSTQWPRLERWLNLFSSDVVEASAELWILKTWLVYHRGQFSELPTLLKRLTTLMEQKTERQFANSLAGEINSLRSLISYHAGDTEGAISNSRRALELLDPELWIVRVMSRMYLGGSLLMRGDVAGGYHAFYGAFEEEKVQNESFKATLLMTACNFHWVNADLQSMAQAAKQCITLCQEIDFREILGYGNYQLGRVYYQQNDLFAAEELFARVVAKPYLNYGISYTSSACGLAMTYQALGKEVEARQVPEETIGFLLQTGNTTLLPIALAVQAEVALMQGRLTAANQWAQKLDPVPPLAPMFGFLAPHLTLVKVWIADNTPTSQNKAGELLSQLQVYLEGIHNTRFLIETFALRALFEQKIGNQSVALSALEKALRLGQPGGFIRLFVDLGPEMARLIAQLRVDNGLQAYVALIRSAFPGSLRATPSMSQDDFREPLTNRELQTLELLRERITNKEIAAQLVISPATVKAYTINIYRKLDVKGRRQAVEKAITMGILPPK